MTQPLRIVFAGTPEFAAAHLKALLNSPYQVVAVYTQPDRPAGRGAVFDGSGGGVGEVDDGRHCGGARQLRTMSHAVYGLCTMA